MTPLQTLKQEDDKMFTLKGILTFYCKCQLIALSITLIFGIPIYLIGGVL